MEEVDEKTAQSSCQIAPAVESQESSGSGKDDVDLAPGPPPGAQIFVVPYEEAISESSDAESGRAVTLLGEETYPEGGLEAWLVALGAWCCLLAALGIMNSVATLQTYVATHQLSDYSEGTIGWIFSVYTALCFLCGIYVGPVFDKYGPRWLIAPGSVGVVACLLITSICTEYWHFMLCFGLLNGVATSLLYTPAITAVGHFFRARRGFASGIVSTGGGVGGVIFPLMMQRLFEQVGWGWAIRALGFLCLFLLIFANILIKKRLPPAKNASAQPDFRILKEKAFFLLVVSVFLLEFGIFIPLAYISSYALESGFSEAFAFQILPILNAASVLGRALPGWWADKIGHFNTNMISMCITILACFAVWLPFGHTTPGLIIFAVMFGFSTGNNISITPVCVGKLCHTQHYGRYYATCYTVVSLACLINLPVAGLIVEASGGDYMPLIIFTGFTQLLAVVAMYVAKSAKVGWHPWTNF